jgi:hypothetical protein
MLIAITSTWAVNLFDPTEANALGLLVAKSFARPVTTEVRRIESVTVIGRREALADESLASARPEDATAPAPTKSHQPSR